MSIPRVKPANWGIGEKLTSAQQNQLDTNTSWALDKRAGETDTLESVVTLGGAGRIIQPAAVGPDAHTTFQADGENLYVRIPDTLTAARNYTLSDTNAKDGDEITFYFDRDQLGSFNVTIKDGAGGPLMVLGPTGESYWGTFRFDLGAWRNKVGGGFIRLVRQVYTATGTWTKPTNMASDYIVVELVGGGGGGAHGGTSSANSTDRWASGGAGGGSSLLRRFTIDVSGLANGFVADVAIGAGGLGGSTQDTDGADGGYSYIDFPGEPDALYIAHGGAGGAQGQETTTSNQPVIALGGPPMAGTRVVDNWICPVATTGAMIPLLQPGQGGHATTQNFPTLTLGGATSPTIANGTSGTSGNGGAAGTAGTDSGSYRGGGGGGGGAGGPLGSGGDGGNGGNANGAGVGAAATAGSNAPANSGAGGGGGGCGGYGSVARGNNAAGGNGGSGWAAVYWWEKSPIP